MTISELNDSTYIVYAMKHYDNPQCESIEEFHEDLNRTKYLKRLFRKYNSSGVLRERLILNHIIIFYNTFGVEASTRLLFYRIEEDLHPLLKTFLVYLNYLPEKYDIPECALVAIPLHNDIIHQLRDI
jgi:hypothetical protein